MPRSYSRTTTSIYRDGDFTGLTLAEQGLYNMLKGQAEITACGTLDLTLRRWARMAAGETPETVRAKLAILEDRGHVVIDEDTEELLVRTFVKFDGGWTNSKRVPVIRDSALAISSPKLRAALAAVLMKLGLRDMASLLVGDAISDALSRQPEDAASDSQHDAQSGFDRVGVTLVDQQSNPQPATSNPSPATPEREPSAAASGMPDEEPSPHCAEHRPHGTDRPCGPCRQSRETFPERERQHRLRQSAATSEAAKERARLVRAAIDQCTLCGPDGRRPVPNGLGPVCDHIHREPGALARARAAVNPESRTA